MELELSWQKFDIESHYHIVPVHCHDHYLLGMR